LFRIHVSRILAWKLAAGKYRGGNRRHPFYPALPLQSSLDNCKRPYSLPYGLRILFQPCYRLPGCCRLLVRNRVVSPHG
jgi:hypothetical protein